MTKTLTEAQRAFIQNYIADLSNRDATKVTKAYQEFERRRQKVAAYIAKLEPASRGTLQTDLDAADVKARGPADGSAPAFDAAYKDLAQVKAAARQAAKGYVASLSPDAIDVRLTQLNRELDHIIRAIAIGRADMRQITGEVPTHEQQKPAGTAGLDAWTGFMDDVTELEAGWRGVQASSHSYRDGAKTGATGLGVKDALNTLAHQVKQLTESDNAAQRRAGSALLPRMLELDKKAKEGGQYFTATVVQTAFDTLDKDFEAALLLLKQPDRQQEAPLGGSFAKIEARQNKRIDDARAMMMWGKIRDASVLDPEHAGASSMPRPALGRFDMTEFADTVFETLDEASIDAGTIAAGAYEAEEGMKLVIAQEAQTPNSDILFDLTTKSLNELRADLGVAANLGPDVRSWPPNTRKLIEEMAKGMAKVIANHNPNRVSDDMRTLTVNGVQYDSPEIIGQGGLGEIRRYKGQPVGGKTPTIVVKSTLAASKDTLLDEEPNPREKGEWTPEQQGYAKRREMSDEMRIHRQVMGGEAGPPPVNVVEMKGAAIGSNGALHMVMAEAEGGDLANFTMGLNSMVQAGVLPRAAREAITQDNLKQAALGLKEMHDRDALHNDLKTPNFLLDGNGNVKIADLGSARTFAEGADPDAEQPPTTDIYQSADFFKSRNERTDVFALGSMLHGMDSDLGITGALTRPKFMKQYAEGALTKHKETALDRLRNAMMDPNPKQRPTIEGVLLTSYLDDADAASPKAISDLKTALATYNRKVGREAGALSSAIDRLRGKLVQIEDLVAKTPSRAVQFRSGNEDMLREIKELQAQLDALNSRPDIMPLVQAIRDAGSGFGG